MGHRHFVGTVAFFQELMLLFVALHLNLALIVELVLVAQMQIVTVVSVVVLDSRLGVVIFFVLFHMSFEGL